VAKDVHREAQHRRAAQGHQLLQEHGLTGAPGDLVLPSAAREGQALQQGGGFRLGAVAGLEADAALLVEHLAERDLSGLVAGLEGLPEGREGILARPGRHAVQQRHRGPDLLEHGPAEGGHWLARTGSWKLLMAARRSMNTSGLSTISLEMSMGISRYFFSRLPSSSGFWA